MESDVIISNSWRITAPEGLDASAKDEFWMRHAISQAKLGEKINEVPVGAVIVKDDTLVASGFNQPICTRDPSAHAEIIAMRAAGKNLNNYRLKDTCLYVTLEPCLMCIGAIIEARISRLVFAAFEPKTGAVISSYDIRALPRFSEKLEIVSGVLVSDSALMLRQFFKNRR